MPLNGPGSPVGPARLFLNLPRPTPRAALLAMASAAALSSAAAQAPLRHVMRDAAQFLELRPEQQRQLLALDARWQQHVAEAEPRAAALRAGAAADKAAALQRLCEQSQALQLQLAQQAQALLDDAQRQRLARLQDAMALLPVIESAQAAHLLPPHLWAPPAGLPAGQLDVPVRYVRQPPAALPGCGPEAPVFRPGTWPGTAPPAEAGGPRRP